MENEKDGQRSAPAMSRRSAEQRRTNERHHKASLTVARTARSQFESADVFHAFNLRRPSAGGYIAAALAGDFAHFVRFGAVL